MYTRLLLLFDFTSSVAKLEGAEMARVRPEVQRMAWVRPEARGASERAQEWAQGAPRGLCATPTTGPGERERKRKEHGAAIFAAYRESNSGQLVQGT